MLCELQEREDKHCHHESWELYQYLKSVLILPPHPTPPSQLNANPSKPLVLKRKEEEEERVISVYVYDRFHGTLTVSGLEM